MADLARLLKEAFALESAPAAVARPEPLMQFSVHPARERPVATVGVLLVMALIGGFTWSLFHQWYMVAVACVMFFTFMANFLLPSHYEVDSEGITVFRGIARHRYPFKRFRRYYTAPRGVVLSPYKDPRGIEQLRAFFLVMTPQQVEALKPLLDEKLTAPPAPPPQTQNGPADPAASSDTPPR